jgi:retron-type reverse transcriptase
MKKSVLISKNNLELAWTRIQTGRNPQHKRFFRKIYNSYAIAQKENINWLHNKLKGTWEPSEPYIIYLPKPSGLQRPISLLRIEDQIVLQAISNIFSKKLFERRKKIENHSVFSNILSNPIDSIFFVQDWRETYSSFQEKCREYFNSGYRWVAHFDLAAFYETISHRELIKRVSPRSGDKDFNHKIEEWFQVWRGDDKSTPINHGIPQGPIASDFLAEAFLLPLDEKLIAENIKFVRYVDDIRIFAKTRFETQTSVMRLELICRNLGLIPQGKKFEIINAKNPSETLGIMPSLAPPDKAENSINTILKVKDAERRFKSTLESRPYKIKDRSLAKYILYRAPKSEKILRQVLSLLPTHPEFIDAFSSFISNYTKSKPIEHKVIEILKNGMPYDYVRGELWHILARITKKKDQSALMAIAKKDAKTSNNSLPKNWGALAFLLACENNNLGNFSYKLKNRNPLLQSLLIEKIPDAEFERDVLIPNLLNSVNYEPGIVLAEQLIKRGKSITDYRILKASLPPQTNNVYSLIGLINSNQFAKVDQVNDLLQKRFYIPNSTIWKKILNTEYIFSLQLLLQADARFNPGKSEWLIYQNSFNEVLFTSLIKILNFKSIFTKPIKLINIKGELVKYGNLLDINQLFYKKYPTISSGFINIHNRRNCIPGTHPYDFKQGNKNSHLTKHEQNKLVYEFKKSLTELIFLAESLNL